MTFTPPAIRAFVDDVAEPASRATISATLAPLVTQSSACERIFCVSPSAFVILAERPAALKAAARYGRSKSSQRTDVLVSGRRTHTSALAAFAAGAVLWAPAVVAATHAPATAPSTSMDFKTGTFTF